MPAGKLPIQVGGLAWLRRGCVDSDCDWAPTDQRQTGCFSAKSDEAKLEEGSEMARDILTDLPFSGYIFGKEL